MNVDSYLEDFVRRDWQTIDEGHLRVAVLGLGDFAVTRALPAIEQTTFCTATVVVSGSPRKAERVASEFDVDAAIGYGAFVDGTAADIYDAVYVATPPAFHREYTEAAADLGKHVLCEKPLAADVSGAQQMVDACARNGVVLMTAYRLRTEPAIRRVREMIHDDVIGDVVQITGGFSTRLLENASVDSWRLDKDLAGGGALLDLGIYPVNLSRFLLEEHPAAVWGDTSSMTAPFDDVEEHASVQLSFPSGVTAVCSASFNAHPDNRLQVLGTDGQILIREPFGGHTPQDLVVERRDTRTEYTGPPVDEVVEEFDYFAHCVLADSNCETDGEDGMADLRIIEAAYDAAASGTRVSL